MRYFLTAAEDRGVNRNGFCFQQSATNINEQMETNLLNKNACLQSRCTEIKNKNELDLKDCPLADNKFSCNTSCNRDHATNIRKSKETMKISTNGGVLAVNRMANLNGHPNTVGFDEQAITNMLSLSLIHI